MNKIEELHYYKHMPMGMGDSPSECQECLKRLDVLEAKQTNYNPIMIGVMVSVLSAFLIERFVKR